MKHFELWNKIEIWNKKNLYIFLFLFISSSLFTADMQSLNISDHSVKQSVDSPPYIATLGGGCFWCLEAIFQHLSGIKKITTGYAGGFKDHPTYDQVCTGRTGHAEVIQIIYDPEKISYNQLLDLFWKAHDPTTLNKQGHDVGTQYRSIILTSSQYQAEIAKKSLQMAQRYFNQPIVTIIEPLTVFYPGELSHQDYYNKNKNKNPYCHAIITPKLESLGFK